MLSKDAVKKALDDAKLDLSDEDQPRTPLLIQIGKALGVDYVLFGIVTATEHKKQKRLLYEDIEGNATVKLWVIDVKAEKAIVSAKSFLGRSGGARISDGKGSQRQIQAAANAYREGLKDFLKLFPEIKN